jgi:photosystem II stability/assembly factor-like uncharacterized protein
MATTHDGGTRWMPFVLPLTGRCRGVASIHEAFSGSAGVVEIACRNQASIFATADAGRTWLDSVRAHASLVSSLGPSTWILSRGWPVRLLVTTDAGAHWRGIATGRHFSGPDGHSLEFNSLSFGWGLICAPGQCVRNRLMATTDGGRTWHAVLTQRQ